MTHYLMSEQYVSSHAFFFLLCLTHTGTSNWHFILQLTLFCRSAIGPKRVHEVALKQLLTNCISAAQWGPNPTQIHFGANPFLIGWSAVNDGLCHQLIGLRFNWAQTERLDFTDEWTMMDHGVTHTPGYKWWRHYWVCNRLPCTKLFPSTLSLSLYCITCSLYLYAPTIHESE